MEVEDIIQEIIDEEDEQLRQQLNSKNKEEDTKSKEEKNIKKMKLILVAIIGLFVFMMVFPWFKLGGNTTYKGFVRISQNIISKEYKDLNISEQKVYEGVFIEASPVDLIVYVFDYFDEHKTIQDEKGNEVQSVFSWLHIIYIISYIGIVLVSLISIFILLIFKELKGLKLVAFFSLIGFLIFALNFIVMKISYFNMFALRALNELRMLEGYDVAILTQKGIAVKTVFYPYTMTLTTPFFLALGLSLTWVIMSVVMSKFKNKRERDARLNG